MLKRSIGCLFSALLCFHLLTASIVRADSLGLPTASSPSRKGVSFELDPQTSTGQFGSLNENSGYLWQGFEHDWKRRVFGVFRTPHRISQLISRILDELHEFDPVAFRIAHQARTDMSQSTGVDGDWMRPSIHYGIFHRPDIEVKRGVLRVEFTDDTESSGKGGNALSIVHGPFSFTSTTWQIFENHRTEVLLQGFSMKTECIAGEQGPESCNSNGIWPYRFKVELTDCQREIRSLSTGEAHHDCGYHIEIGRAWTPNRGGLPPFETKPLNRFGKFEFEIGVQTLSGQVQTLDSRHQFVSLTGMRSLPRSREHELRTVMVGSDAGKYPSALVGVRGVRV
jgi:hypothetical protein